MQILLWWLDRGSITGRHAQSMKTKDLTDKQIEEQINALEEENANTKRLSMGRGHGWGDDAIEQRRNKILHLNSILMARRLQKSTPPPKKQGLTRTWNSKTKRWVYHITQRERRKLRKNNRAQNYPNARSGF